MTLWQRLALLGSALLTVGFFVRYVWLSIVSDGCEECGRRGERLYKVSVSDADYEKQICYSCAHSYAVTGRLDHMRPSFDRPQRRRRRDVRDKGVWP